MNKKILLIDMDNVLFDFNGATHTEGYGPPEMYRMGFFENLQPLPGAREGIARLLKSGLFDMWICTKPLAHSSISYTEKANSISKHFPLLLGKIIMTQDKGMIHGDILIDDHPLHGEDFINRNPDGQFYHFGSDVAFDGNYAAVSASEWDRIVSDLVKIKLPKTPRGI